MTKILVICGPTASGKTQFAHSMALRYNGEIVNCDSMQVYHGLPILSASPSLQLRSELPYHLYNFQTIEQHFSVVRYVKLAAPQIKKIINQGRLPIVVGGSGLYINALLYGYNKMPQITYQVKKHVRELQAKYGGQHVFNLLKKIDPQAATRLNINDTQRVLRAYEVCMQTGKSIFALQDKQNTFPLKGFDFKIILLYPERHFLYNACNQRLIAIFNEGAIEEVKNIKAHVVNLNTPASKIIGLQEITAFLDGAISIDQAISYAQARTRQYAKRQITWFKNQLPEKTILQYKNTQEFQQLKI